MALIVRNALIEIVSLLVHEPHIAPREVIISETEYLGCLKYYAPVGVFGFYWWFSKLVGLLIASGAAIQVMMGSDNRWGGAVQAFATITVAIFDMVTGLRTSDQCLLVITNNDPKPRLLQPTRVARFFFVRHVGNGMILWAGLAEAASALSKSARHGLFVVPVAYLFHLLGACAYYVGFTNFTNIDQSMLRPIMALSIPLLVIFLITFAIICRADIYNFCGSAALLLGISIGFFHIWAVGMGHILIGNASGDIWGSYVVTQKVGKVYAALTGVFPILTVIGVPGQL